jgi:hypothetical protein
MHIMCHLLQLSLNEFHIQVMQPALCILQPSPLLFAHSLVNIAVCSTACSHRQSSDAAVTDSVGLHNEGGRMGEFCLLYLLCMLAFPAPLASLQPCPGTLQVTRPPGGC